jgi:hypothetical protein
MGTSNKSKSPYLSRIVMSKKIKKNIDSADEDEKFPLPIYKKGEDIYNKEEEIPLDDVDKLTSGIAKKETGPADDLDIPGAELDDADEAIGEEDEENNYYSLGGDNHNDLEEEKE